MAQGTDTDYYAYFFNGLTAIIDDAEQGGYDREATELLRKAQALFKEEFKRRHPEWWSRTE